MARPDFSITWCFSKSAVSSAVECYLDTVVVTGSSPVPRSWFIHDRSRVCFLHVVYLAMTLSEFYIRQNDLPKGIWNCSLNDWNSPRRFQIVSEKHSAQHAEKRFLLLSWPCLLPFLGAVICQISQGGLCKSWGGKAHRVKESAAKTSTSLTSM